MAKNERPAAAIRGEEERIVHATWSRSGKSLILSVARDASFSEYTQVLLTPRQANELATILVRGPG